MENLTGKEEKLSRQAEARIETVKQQFFSWLEKHFNGHDFSAEQLTVLFNIYYDAVHAPFLKERRDKWADAAETYLSRAEDYIELIQRDLKYHIEFDGRRRKPKRKNITLSGEVSELINNTLRAGKELLK